MSAILGSGWGRSEHRFATDAMREARTLRAFTGFIGTACLSLAVLGLVVQFHPYGPHGPVARGIHVVVLLSAVLVGLRWLLGRWPSHRLAVAYVVWADGALTMFSVTMSTPAAQLSTTLYMAMLGIFACFILGTRVLILHCVFAAVVIDVIVGLATLSDSSAGFDLFVFYMPAMAWVVVAPLGAGILIQRGRLAIGRTARSAHHDALTGLRNRRGFYAALNTAMATRTDPMTIVMAVCDIDHFKQLNDQLGHFAGDAALTTMARQLSAMAHRDEITARIGGDEFVLVSFSERESAMDDLKQRFVALTRVDVEGAAPTASVGIASSSTSDPHFSVDDVLRHADAAMYEAKQSGGGSCVIHDGPPSSVTEENEPVRP